MVIQRTGQLPGNSAKPMENGTVLLEKIGWGMLGVAVGLWAVASVILLYSRASNQTGWGLLLAFAVLIAVGLGLLATGRTIERSLFQREPFREELVMLPPDMAWVEHWNELMGRPVR